MDIYFLIFPDGLPVGDAEQTTGKGDGKIKIAIFASKTYYIYVQGILALPPALSLYR